MGWAAGLWLVWLGALAGLPGAPAPGVRAQIVEPGICPFSTPLADWDVEQFVSEPWYELKAFALPGMHDSSPGCTRWYFTASPDGRGLHARLAYRAREGDAVVRAFAQYTVSEKQPRFNMTFHDLEGGASRSVMMKLIASDYNDFALLWGCSEHNLFEREVVTWVLSRKPFLSEDAEKSLCTLYRQHDIRTRPERSVGDSVPAAEPADDNVDDGMDDVDDDDDDVEGEEEKGSVSRIYIGASWPMLGAQGMLQAVAVLLAVISFIACLLILRVHQRWLQKQRSLTEPLCPRPCPRLCLRPGTGS